MIHHLIDIAPVFVLMLIAGVCNNVYDIAENRVKYYQSVFQRFTGLFWGPKPETWGNKWKRAENGSPIVGEERFFGSSTFLVWITDFWHLSKTIFLTIIQVSILFYCLPDVWWWALIDLITIKIFFSAGWHLGNLFFMRTNTRE
jgi:hypothetical protein